MILLKFNLCEQYKKCLITHTCFTPTAHTHTKSVKTKLSSSEGLFGCIFQDVDTKDLVKSWKTNKCIITSKTLVLVLAKR